MKVRRVTIHRRKRCFEVRLGEKIYDFPFVRSEPMPSPRDPVLSVRIDPEIAREGFVYRLASGAEGTVLADQVLDYNSDPDYLRDLLLYQLSVEALDRAEASGLAKRELARRLGTSAGQLYRLLDPTNYRKTVDQMLKLLHVLDCDVELVVRDRKAS